MVLAEGERLGFYTSTNLREWTYVSDFAREGYGLLGVSRPVRDGRPGLGAPHLGARSERGAARTGGTTGFAYWTGTWDGERFTADSDEPQWLDGGSDFYAAVTWDDPRDGDRGRLERRFALAWVNNWGTPGSCPGAAGRAAPSRPRARSRCARVDGRLTLLSQPVTEVAAREGRARSAAAPVTVARGASRRCPCRAPGAPIACGRPCLLPTAERCASGWARRNGAR